MFEHIPLQIGVDLATAFSIIGASYTYVRSERRKSIELAERDKDFLVQRRKEMAYLIIDEVASFLPEVYERGKVVKKTVDELRLGVCENNMGGKNLDAAKSIVTVFNEIDDAVEFYLMRPLSLKVGAIGCSGEWERASVAYEKSISVLRIAFKGLKNSSGNSNISDKDMLKLFGQVAPLLYSEKAIEGQVESLYSALVKFGNDLKDELLKSPNVPLNKD